MRLNEGVSDWKSQDMGSGSTSAPTNLNLRGLTVFLCNLYTEKSILLLLSRASRELLPRSHSLLTDAGAPLTNASLSALVKEVITGPSLVLQ